MAKAKMSLLRCLQLTQHHVMPNKVAVMAVLGKLTTETVEYRFKLVQENMQSAIDQLTKIQKIAEEVGCREILDALKEPIEAGHD